VEKREIELSLGDLHGRCWGTAGGFFEGDVNLRFMVSSIFGFV